MGDDWILLKLKREFTTDEAVQALLKIVSSLEQEIGVLKSEKDELSYELHKVRTAIPEGNIKPKKAWLKDELVANLEETIKNNSIKNKEANKKMIEWRDRYFSLLAKQPKTDG